MPGNSSSSTTACTYSPEPPTSTGVRPAASTRSTAALAAGLWVAGRAPWQVLAGATRDGTWEGELLHSTRTFGVGYHVAVWQRCG